MNSNKLISRVLYGIIYLLISGVVIYGLGQLLEYFNKGATNPIYNSNSELFELAPSEILWLEDDSDIKGPMNPYLRKDIEKAYAKAWQVKNLSIYHNKDLGLKEHYTEPLQEKIKSNFKSAKDSINVLSESHNLKLHFVSLDKQIVSFSDLSSIRKIEFRSSINNRSLIDTSNFKVIMTLDDGKWRVKQIHKIKTGQ